MQITMLKNIDIKKIKPNNNNPRKNDNAVEKVIESIQKTGYISPIIIDETNTIIAGHTRYKALKKLNYKTVPHVVKIEGLTKEQKKLYMIMDNKTHEFATWDYNKLETLFDTNTLIEFGFHEYNFKKNLDAIKNDDKEIQPFVLNNKCPRCGYEW